MNTLKHVTKISSLFLILLGVAIAPIAIAQIQNEHLINQIHTDVLQKEEIDDNLQTAEKIAIIQNAFHKKNGTTVRQEQVFSENSTNIVTRTLEQLEQLQEIHVIPSFDLTQAYTVKDISKIIFLDNNSPQKIVSIRYITLAYANYSIEVWIDNDTSVIYHFAVFSEEELPQFKERLSPLKYLEYLGFPSKNISYKGDEYGGYYSYSAENIDFAYAYEVDKHYIGFYPDF